MNIRPKIPMLLGGNVIGLGVPNWKDYFELYNKIYPNSGVLGGLPLKKRTDNWQLDNQYDIHHQKDNLEAAAWSNYNYTLPSNQANRKNDILYYFGNVGKKFSDAHTAVKYYNDNIDKIFNTQSLPRTYNMSDTSWGNFNDNYNLTYNSKGEGINNSAIPYDVKNKLYYGTSTYARRPTWYLDEFNNQPDRIHTIKINGKDVTVGEEANGHLRILNPNLLASIQLSPKLNLPDKLDISTKIPTGDYDGKTGGIDWDKLKEVGKKIFGNPNLYSFGRLIGNIHNNDRVYDEALKGINPVLSLSYNTHRQVLGDESTKQAYYRRAVQGQTKAAQPFTSDADRQIAYLQEAKRIGDELRALGDLADNQEIRRTSDESNLHQWTNLQRNAEIANKNIASINQANALRHNLLALKHSAQWSSIDNYLKEIEYRKRQLLERDRALQDQIWALTEQNNLENNSEYIALLKAADDAWNNALNEGKTPQNEESVKQAILNLKNWKTKYLILMLKSRPSLAKSGTKLTYKKKDDLLYKSAKDVVEHFRKMSKISSDALNRKKPKIEKLTSHPKTKKYLLGGIAPFTVYTPVAMGGESSYLSTSSGSSKSSSKSEGSDTLDMIKELFKEVAGKVLPSDANSLYTNMKNFLDKSKAFGNEISTDDIASIYLQQMLQLNSLYYLKNTHDKAIESARNNNALNEFAVDFAGRLLCQNKDTGKLEYTSSWDEAILKGLTPLTNGQVLNLRATAFSNSPELDNIVANGIGLDKIAAYIKSIKPNIGSIDLTKEGYTKAEAEKIKAGFDLIQDSNGDLTYTEHTQDLQSLIAAAFLYINSALPTNMKAIIKLHADLNEVNPNTIVSSLLGAETNYTYSRTLDNTSSKDSKKDGSSTKEGGSIKTTFNDMVQRGQIGVPREFSMITKDGQTKLYSLDSKYVSELPEVSSDMSIDLMLSLSGIGLILDSRLGITFGDQILNPENLKDIMFSIGGGATFVTLPCKYENGHKIVNFAIKDDFDAAIDEASKTTPIDWTDIKFKRNLANILKLKGLDSLLIGNMDLDPNMLGQFLVVEGYSTDRVKFNKNSKYIEKIDNPNKNLEDRLNNALSIKGPDGKVLKYDADINDWGLGFLFEGGWDDIYHGNIFIPLNNDPLSAQIGNDTLKQADAYKLAGEYQNYLKLKQAKNTNSDLL